MFRFSVVLAGVLALSSAAVISVSPASALTGSAYDKCMAKCQTSGGHKCNHWCEKR